MSGRNKKAQEDDERTIAIEFIYKALRKHSYGYVLLLPGVAPFIAVLRDRIANDARTIKVLTEKVEVLQRL